MRQQNPRLTAEELKEQELTVIKALRPSHEYVSADLQFCLLNYNRQYWIYHLTNGKLIKDNRMWELFRACVEGRNPLAIREWVPEVDNSDQADDPKLGPARRMLYWALQYQNESLIRYQQKHFGDAWSRKEKLRLLKRATTMDDARSCAALFDYLCSPLASELAAELAEQTFVLAAALGSINSVKDLRGRVAGYVIMTTLSFTRTWHEVVDKNDPVQLVAIYGRHSTFEESWYGGLEAATEFGHRHVVQLLLEQEGLMNCTLHDGLPKNWQALRQSIQQAMFLASANSFFDILDDLATATFKVNAPNFEWGGTLLSFAATNGKYEIVDRLLQANLPPDVHASRHAEGALYMATTQGHSKIVRRLRLAGVCIDLGRLYNSEGETSLHVAAQGGDIETMAALLEVPVSTEILNAVDRRFKQTALCIAVANDYYLIVKQLITAGADVNNSASELMPGRGLCPNATALQFAVELGHIASLCKLLEADDISINAKDRSLGRTILHSAVSQGRFDMVDAILAAGAELDAQDRFWWQTPLWLAIDNDESEMVDHLLKAGANPREGSRRYLHVSMRPDLYERLRPYSEYIV